MSVDIDLSSDATPAEIQELVENADPSELNELRGFGVYLEQLAVEAITDVDR
jgi:hypothetical protein